MQCIINCNNTMHVSQCPLLLNYRNYTSTYVFQDGHEVNIPFSGKRFTTTANSFLYLLTLVLFLLLVALPTEKHENTIMYTEVGTQKFCAKTITGTLDKHPAQQRHLPFNYFHHFLHFRHFLSQSVSIRHYCVTFRHSSHLLNYSLHTSYSRVLLEKLTGLQLVKEFPHFMEPDSSLPYSQVPAITDHRDIAEHFTPLDV